MSSNKDLQPPRGTYDALPEMTKRLAYIENTARKVFHTYGAGEIRTPIFEQASLFSRTVGEATDIVSKEMYLFEDRNGEQMSLRPEGTAPVARAYYSNGLKHQLPVKMYYVGAPMFRYERPQKGRFRQFHQLGLEIFGIASPNADIEVIAAGVDIMSALGLNQDIVVKLNSLGTKEDRANYRKVLLDYFEPVKDKLSEESKLRLAKNPLRVLDSKEPEDKPYIPDAPMPIDYLSEESTAHFEAVKAGLDALGIKYEIDASLVRGLDYYTHTVFEVHGMGLGAQSQVIGGGRFDGLIENIGGDSIPAVGFGCGMERLESITPELPSDEQPVAFIIPFDEGYNPSFKLAAELRKNNIQVQFPLEPVSFKAQMKRANKVNASYAIIVGEDEVKESKFMLKNMETGDQELLSHKEILAKLKI